MAPPQVGAALRSARARLGWTREALAFHSGVSWAAIAQIESGRRKDIHISSLVALADALGVSLDYLVGSPGTAPQLFEHRVLLYGSDAAFTAAAVPFLTEGAERSHCLLAVASRAKISLLRRELGDSAHLVEFAEWSDWYRSPRVALDRYRDYVTQKCERDGNWIRIVAEAGWANETGQKLAAWNRYEALVNLVFAPWPATIMCTYDERAFSKQDLVHARRCHPAIAHGTATSTNPKYRDPSDLLLAPGVTSPASRSRTAP
jgi:transcriptional regulator with XRE-family HTH domain